MRLLLLLAVAAAAIAFRSSARRSGRSESDGFLEALLRGAEGLSCESGIQPPGRRVELFRGSALGRPFVFIAWTDAIAARWTYVLDWRDRRLSASWDVRTGRPDPPFRRVHLELRRLSVG